MKTRNLPAREANDMAEEFRDSVKWLPKELREAVELRHQPEAWESEASEVYHL